MTDGLLAPKECNAPPTIPILLAVFSFLKTIFNYTFPHLLQIPIINMLSPLKFHNELQALGGDLYSISSHKKKNMSLVVSYNIRNIKPLLSLKQCLRQL